MQTTLQVSVGTIKAELCERGHFLFLRCLYWVKYGLLCNSWPSPRLFLDPSCVSRADVCDGKLQAMSEWYVPLSPHSLPRGTVNSSGAGSKPHSRVHLLGPPQLSQCFLDEIHPASCILPSELHWDLGTCYNHPRLALTPKNSYLPD